MAATPAWTVATNRAHTPPGGVTLLDVLPAFEGLDEALQSGADYPGLLDWEDGVGLFSRSGRAMHAGGTPGVAVEGDAKFGDAYKTEDLAVQEAEEQADQLCYRALRLLRGEKLTLRQRLGLRLWALGMRWAR